MIDNYAYPWNAPREAVNPYISPQSPKPSALSNLIALYKADDAHKIAQQEALSDEVWNKFFFNETRAPIQREYDQQNKLSHVAMAKEQQALDPVLHIIADVKA